MWRRWLPIAVALAGLIAAGIAYRAHARRQLHRELTQARRDMDDGRYATARRRLKDLAGHWPAEGELFFRLGVCEQSLGRFDAALDAWEHVDPGSRFGAAPRHSGPTS